MTRDEYVAKLKTQLDDWNAQAAVWEAKAKDAQATAKAEFERQLVLLKAQQENAAYQMRLLQNASADAWKDLSAGADAAWKQMSETFARAASHFEKK